MEDDCENSLPRGTPIIPATRSSDKEATILISVKYKFFVHRYIVYFHCRDKEIQGNLFFTPEASS